MRSSKKGERQHTVVIENAPIAIMKYTMRSVLPIIGSMKGLWTRIYFKRRSVTGKGVPMEEVLMASAPLTKTEALELIEKESLVKVASDLDTSLWTDPNNSFKEYVKLNKVAVPDDIGLRLVGEDSWNKDEI